MIGTSLLRRHRLGRDRLRRRDGDRRMDRGPGAGGDGRAPRDRAVPARACDHIRRAGDRARDPRVVGPDARVAQNGVMLAILVGLLAAGVEVLRRQVIREHPDASRAEAVERWRERTAAFGAGTRRRAGELRSSVGDRVTSAVGATWRGARRHRRRRRRSRSWSGCHSCSEAGVLDAGRGRAREKQRILRGAGTRRATSGPPTARAGGQGLIAAARGAGARSIGRRPRRRRSSPEPSSVPDDIRGRARRTLPCRRRCADRTAPEKPIRAQDTRPPPRVFGRAGRGRDELRGRRGSVPRARGARDRQRARVPLLARARRRAHARARGFSVRLIDRCDFPSLGEALWWAVVKRSPTVGDGDARSRLDVGQARRLRGDRSRRDLFSLLTATAH